MPKTSERDAGPRIENGTLVRERGGYYCKVGRRKLRIDDGPIVSKRELGRLADKPVRVLFANEDPKTLLAIAARTESLAKCYWILCYYPGPEFMQLIDDTVRQALVRKMVSEGVLTRSLAREIRQSF